MNLDSTLIGSMMTDCTMLDKKKVPDGVGGTKSAYMDGISFQAAVTKANTMEAKIAAKSGVTELYTVTVPKGVELDYHDVFRRESDGTVFRVTSNITDSETPAVASFQIGQVSAERYDLKNA